MLGRVQSILPLRESSTDGKYRKQPGLRMLTVRATLMSLH
jgi:hypothetical protein